MAMGVDLNRRGSVLLGGPEGSPSRIQVGVMTTWRDVADEPERLRRKVKGNTPPRSVRIPDELWHAAAVEAERRGETITDAIVRSLKRYARTTHHERTEDSPAIESGTSE